MTEKYRKKPVEVEVMRYDKRNYRAALVFAPDVAGFDWLYEKLTLKTLEGEMTVSDGDYIIKGVQGEFYPCKPDIFHETYEPVSDHQPTIEVGEYVAAQHPTNGLTIIKIEKIESSAIRGKMYDRINGIFNEDLKSFVHVVSCVLAAAEQIAEFKRAEHFAKHGRKLDEFRVGDKVLVDNAKLGTIFQIKNGTIDAKRSGFRLPIICLEPEGLTLIQTAEELKNGGNSQ